MIKQPAVTAPYKGMLLMNPGGPGGSGLYNTLIHPEIQEIAGLNYDLVSWDPRGVGLSIPSGDCEPSNSSTPANATLSKLRQRSTDQFFRPELKIETLQNLYDESLTMGKTCQRVIGGPDGAGPHMTTATVARDMMTIVDAFAMSADAQKVENPSLLNYWGFSYGTFLGQTVASMFPNRMGRVVIDAVMDPDDAISGRTFNLNNLADDAFSTFFLYCNLAGPSQCPFYTGSTPYDIFLRFENMMNRFNRSDPLELVPANKSSPQTIRQGLRNAMHSYSYRPLQYFPIVANGLVASENISMNVTWDSYKNVRAAFLDEEVVTENNTWAYHDVTRVTLSGIWCSDNGNIMYNVTLPELMPYFQAIANQSYLGNVQGASQAVFCARWPIASDDRFAGDHSHTTVQSFSVC
jgi:pimeloyl-ACP methyl ester carboxylesterase